MTEQFAFGLALGIALGAVIMTLIALWVFSTDRLMNGRNHVEHRGIQKYNPHQ